MLCAFRIDKRKKGVDPRGLEPLTSAMRDQVHWFTGVRRPSQTRIGKPILRRAYSGELFCTCLRWCTTGVLAPHLTEPGGRRSCSANFACDRVSEVRDYGLLTSSCSMCSLISSRTLRKIASRSSSEPSAREGSSKDQCSLLLAPGKNGQASFASSQTGIT